MNRVAVTKLTDWTQVSSVSNAMSPFVFRGQEDASWPLSTSLERAVTDYCDERNRRPTNREHWMLYEFKRKAKLYLADIPENTAHFEWLAIMQHHGCPTRLLDFTSSIFVAAFFAIERTRLDSAIWCVNKIKLRDVALQALNFERDRRQLRDVMNEQLAAAAHMLIGAYRRTDLPDLVLPLEPLRLTDRMNRQQGLFLMPSDTEKPFQSCLTGAFGLSADELDDPYEMTAEELKSMTENFVPYDEFPLILKLVLPKRLISHGMKMLRDMNITSETLFPGVDGMARSLVQVKIRL